MPNKKLHYTDPLAAAYMAREFGVKYFIYDKDTGEEILRDDEEHILELYICGNEDEGNYYIHPDSYHIFEPQVGDLIKRGAPHEIYQGKEDLHIFLSDERMLETNTNTAGKKLRNKIIQRNGKQFFTRKEETDG